MTYCYSVYHDNFRDSTGQCTGIHRRITGSSPGRTAVRASQGIGFASLRVLDRLVRLCKPVIKAAMPPFSNENQLRSKTFLSLSLIITRTNVRVNAIIGGRASTASVATLAKNGVGRLGFTCRAASKSGEYPHRKNRAFRLTAETLCFCILG